MTKEIEEKGMSMDEVRKRNMWSIVPISKLPDNSPVLAITQYPSKALAEFHLAEECIVPALLTPSGDVQERAKEIFTKHWRKYAENRYERSYQNIDIPPTYDKQFIIDAMVEIAGHAGASSELEALKAENEMLRKKIEQIREDSFSEGYDEGVQDHGE